MSRKKLIELLRATPVATVYAKYGNHVAHWTGDVVQVSTRRVYLSDVIESNCSGWRKGNGRKATLQISKIYLVQINGVDHYI